MKPPKIFTIFLMIIVIIASVFTIGFMKKDSIASTIGVYRSLSGNSTEPKDEPVSLSEDVKKTMDDIDKRVAWINNNLNSFTCREENDYTDYLEGNHLVYREFYNIVDCFVSSRGASRYTLYYDENGKWIYADIARYRGALYSMYIQDNGIFHVETGPFEQGGPVVNGDLTDVIHFVKEYPGFGFILEDYGLCLENVQDLENWLSQQENHS